MKVLSSTTTTTTTTTTSSSSFGSFALIGFFLVSLCFEVDARGRFDEAASASGPSSGPASGPSSGPASGLASGPASRPASSPSKSGKGKSDGKGKSGGKGKSDGGSGKGKGKGKSGGGGGMCDCAGVEEFRYFTKAEIYERAVGWLEINTNVDATTLDFTDPTATAALPLTQSQAITLAPANCYLATPMNDFQVQVLNDLTGGMDAGWVGAFKDYDEALEDGRSDHIEDRRDGWITLCGATVNEALWAETEPTMLMAGDTTAENAAIFMDGELFAVSSLATGVDGAYYRCCFEVLPDSCYDGGDLTEFIPLVEPPIVEPPAPPPPAEPQDTAPPTATPTSAPSTSPSNTPSTSPSNTPSTTPSVSPSDAPSTNPSTSPSNTPSTSPSVSPSDAPSTGPSTSPSNTPSAIPSNPPSTATDSPTTSPSDEPSDTPSTTPSAAPSTVPSTSPSNTPSAIPSASPSDAPSNTPSGVPSRVPSTSPSDEPSAIPSASPSDEPSDIPSAAPSTVPSTSPSDEPSDIPSTSPSDAPSNAPSGDPTALASAAPSPTPDCFIQIEITGCTVPRCTGNTQGGTVCPQLGMPLACDSIGGNDDQVLAAYDQGECLQEVTLTLEVTNTGMTGDASFDLLFAGIGNVNEVTTVPTLAPEGIQTFTMVTTTVDVCGPTRGDPITNTVTANAEGQPQPTGDICVDDGILEITLPSIGQVQPTPAPSVSPMPTESQLPTRPDGLPVNRAEPCVVREYNFNLDTSGPVQGELARQNGITQCQPGEPVAPQITQANGPLEAYLIIGNFEPINEGAANEVTACVFVEADFTACSNNAYQVIIYQPFFNSTDIRQNYISYSGGTEQGIASFSGTVQENLPYQIVLVQTEAISSGLENCRFSLGAFDDTCPSQAPSGAPTQ